MYHYLLVGADLTAAVFAHEALARGRSVLVVEKRPHVAGIHVHRYGARVFSSNSLPAASERIPRKFVNGIKGFL